MKPTSIIFLIISVLLIIAGFITVGVAGHMGASEGIVLNDSAEDATEIYEYEKDNIGKIIVNVEDADINIIGGAAKSYVELINFFDGTYDLTSTNRVLTVRDSIDMTDIEGVASLAMNFKGLRGVVNYMKSRGLEKTVNIYLTDAYPINVANCTIGTGNVTVKSNKNPTDYIMNIGTGTAELTDVYTTSKLETVIGEGGVTLDNCQVSHLVCDIEKGYMKATAKLFRVDADIAMGDFTYKCTEGLGVTGYNLVCQSGHVIFNGTERGGILNEENPTTDNLIAVTVGAGDIVISE